MALLMLVVFCLRPRNAAARLLLLFFVLLSSTAAPTRVADMFDRAAFWTGLFFNDAIWSWLILPILIHLCLAFPVRKSFLQRHPRLTLSMIYGLVPGVHVLLVLLLISQPRSFPPIYDLFGVGWFVILLLIMVSSVGHSFLTVRDPVGRAQLRWVAFGLLVGLGGSFAVYQLVVWGFGENDLFGISGSVMFLAFPVSLAVAILRYRLFDIDVIINRTLVYGALTAALGLVYVVSVVVLQTLIRAFSGEQQSELVTVGSTLVIAALFTPLRRRIQQTIDRRFYRRKYDAVRTLAALSVKLRDEVDLSALTAELLVVVEETLQPAHASLWLCVPKPKATTHTSNVSSR